MPEGDNEELFTENDLLLLHAVKFDPDLSPRFQDGAEALTWKDEWPPGDFSPQGVCTISDLWVARSFLHHGQEFTGTESYKEHLKSLWQRAQAMHVKWPGFQKERLTLSDEHKALLSQQKEAAAAFKDY